MNKIINQFGLAGFILTIGAVSPLAFAQEKMAPGLYEIDSVHSKVGFEVSHLVISTAEGRFNQFEGSLQIAPKVEDSTVSVTIDAASIDTANAKRDDHLRSADFFETSKYPKILFKSKKVVATPTGLKIIGDLTIKDKTQEAILDAKYLGTAQDGYGNKKVAFQATTKISRRAYGVSWNKIADAGPMVGDEVSISLKIQAAPASEKKAAKL